MMMNKWAGITCRRSFGTGRSLPRVMDRALLKLLSFSLRIVRQCGVVRTDVPNAASLRPTLASLNHRTLTLAVVLLSGLLAPMSNGSLECRVGVLAVEGAFCLALFGLHSKLRAYILDQWEITMQGVLRSALLTEGPAATT